MALVQIEISEVDLKRLVNDYLSEKLGVTLEPSDINIEVKSRQNYRSEWEVAQFRARVCKTI